MQRENVRENVFSCNTIIMPIDKQLPTEIVDTNTTVDRLVRTKNAYICNTNVDESRRMNVSVDTALNSRGIDEPKKTIINTALDDGSINGSKKKSISIDTLLNDIDNDLLSDIRETTTPTYDTNYYPPCNLHYLNTDKALTPVSANAVIPTKLRYYSKYRKYTKYTRRKYISLYEQNVSIDCNTQSTTTLSQSTTPISACSNGSNGNTNTTHTSVPTTNLQNTPESTGMDMYKMNSMVYNTTTPSVVQR